MAMYFALVGAFVGAIVGAFVRPPTCFGRLRMGIRRGILPKLLRENEMVCKNLRAGSARRACVDCREEGRSANERFPLSLTPSPALPRIPFRSGGILI